MKGSILTIILVTNILFFSYALPTDNESDKVTYSPPTLTAVADAGPDTTLTCVVNTVTLEGINTSMGPEFTYEWTDENGNVIGTDPAVEVFEPGEFILSVTNTNTSFEDMDTTIVTLNFDEVEFSIIDPEFLTCTNSAVLIDLVLNDPNTNATFSWEGPGGGGLSTEEDLVATLSGEYTVIVTNAENGCSVMESVAVFENTSFPIAVALVQQELSCTQTVVLLEGDSDDPNASFEWRNDAGFVISNDQNAEVAEPGVYTLTVTNLDNGCNASDEVVVVSNQEEEETINVPPITTSESSITLDIREFIDIDLGLEAWDIEWTFPDGSQTISNNPTLEINQTGIYTCIATNPINGCATTLIYTVNFMTILVADAGPDQTLTCINSSVTLGGPNNPTTTDVIYEWTDAAQNIVGNQINVSIDLPGVYTLTVTNIVTGETASDETTVFDDFDTPDVFIGSPEELNCVNESVTLFATSNTPNVSYIWNSNSGGILSTQTESSVTVNQEGPYTLTVTNNSNGCTAISSVLVVVDRTVETINVPTITTSNTIATLNATEFIDLALSPWEFSWTDQNGTPLSSAPTLDVNQTGIYTCVATNAINGCPTTIIYTVNFMTILVADAGPDQTLTCDVNAVTLGGPNTTTGQNISYIWTDESGNQISGAFQTDVFQAGQYTLTVNDVSTGEMAIDVVIVTENIEVPDLSISPSPTITCFTPTATLVATVSNVDPSNAIYAWETFDGNILSDPSQASIIVDQGGVYTLTIFNSANNCIAEEIVDVNVEQENQTEVQPTISSTTPTYIIDPSNFIQDPNCTYAWTMQAGLTVTNFPLAEISQAGTYTFVKTDSATGCTTSFIYTVQFVSGTVADAGPDVEITCNNPNATIGSNNTSVGPNFISVSYTHLTLPTKA